MRQIRICIYLALILAIFAKIYEAKLIPSVGHKLNKREDVVNKHQRDPGKAFPLGSKLQPVLELTPNTTRLYDVKTLQGRNRSVKNYTQLRNYHESLQLSPPSQFAHRSYNLRSQKLSPRDGRNKGRYYNPRMRNQRSRQPEDLTSSFSRWFFADDSDEVLQSKPPSILARHSPHRSSTYHSYPPYWQSGPSPPKFNSFSRFHKSRAVNHRPVTNNKINFVKKECNACNSVPWTPILKPSAVHHESFDDSQSYGVPTIDVHHDSSAYDTTHQQKIVPPPAPVVEHSPDSTIPASYGLPIGNIPTAHGLLPPINHLKTAPTGLVPPPPTLLSPVPAGTGLLQSIPFPELSPIPVVPLHDSNQFLQVETADLVPPVPPPKSVSNVVLTISENGPGHNNGIIDNHISQTNSFTSLDQHSEPSSYVGTHWQSHIQRPYNQYNPTNNHVNLDIIKSVPVAEFTSSIEYPIQIIQSPQYIDIATLPNATKQDTPTYEKQPQTGSQKISDILFGLVKDSGPKITGTESSGTKNIAGQSVQQTKTQQINHYLPTNLPPVSDGLKNTYVDNSQSYRQNQQYTSNLIFNPPQTTVWSEHSGDNSQTYLQPSPNQPKLESGNEGLFPDPTSTSWLIPAQSNLAPQWVLPVSNPPSIPYPILPEDEGIASAVNGELSPTPPPQPMNDPKAKKIQIIIPYTTGDNNKNYDQSILETAQSEIYRTTVNSNVSQPKPPVQKPNQGRKVPGQQITEFSVPINATQNSKFINDVHHILALNIKDLLKDEVEKPKSEQNIRLQKNIDNWTALEYSNHKTVAKKEPQDVISYANAVTSIPGTSISHLLLTSKKIPDKYLTTTPLPKFDEPTTHFPAASSVSVESKPFTTKTYDTSGLYSTVTRIAPTTTTLKSILRNVLNENKNHRNGYTEVVKTKANQWGKLNENLVLPEKVSNRSVTSEWSSKKTGSQDENVYVVTPVSVWQASGGEVSKRTTRQVFMTEKPEVENATISPEATKSYIAKLFGNKTERAKISKFNKPKPIQKFFATTRATPRNITKVEIKDIPVSKFESYDDAYPDNTTEKKSINDVFPFRNGGELPLELAIVNMTKGESSARNGEILQTANIKTSKNVQGSKKLTNRSYSEEGAQTLTTTEIPDNITTDVFIENTTVVIVENSTEIVINAEETAFGQKIAKEDKKTSNKSVNSLGNVSKKEKKTSNLPPGIFGETKKIHTTQDDDSLSDIASINETIRLLKEYLKDTSDELPQDKTEGTQYFKEEDRP